MLICENEQFHLLGPFNHNALVKRVSEIYRQDDCINDGKTHLSYSLLCSSALSKEERKNMVRKFKSNQRKREIYNKYDNQYLQLEPAKKKQRCRLMGRGKKEELLETCTKKYKEIDASTKKQLLNRKAAKCRKRKISKLHVDVCISQFCQKIKEGPYYACTVYNRMLYNKYVLLFNMEKKNCKVQNIFTEKK